MSKAKRSSLSLSKEEAAFFQACHKETAARSIGASVKETILNLRKQVEENKKSEDPSVHPFSGEPLSKRESAYIQYIQKTKGFQTVREAFAYFQGRLEGSIEKRLGTTALEETVGEGSQPPAIPQTHQCPFYSFKGGWVHCKKDEAKKEIIHRVSQGVCDECWIRTMSKKQGPQDTVPQIEKSEENALEVSKSTREDNLGSSMTQ
jgi:hypothetical protein